MDDNKVFCPMIHGGLNIDLKHTHTSVQLSYNQCCLSSSRLHGLNDNQIPWQSDALKDMREKNNNKEWSDSCWQCKRLEENGSKSFRMAMIEKFGIQQQLSGPQRIDLLFDRSCNLACVTCGPRSSTFWEKHLVDNNQKVGFINDDNHTDKILAALSSLNLENLGMVQFCGGETLLGNSYWRVAQAIANMVPDPKKIEIGFQTNGTQTISPKWFDLIERFGTVKLLVSIDGTHDRFEYLRWPASWNQTIDNLYSLKEKLPNNVMFFVQECTSCLNLFYYHEVKDWVSKHFNSNRDGDPIEHATQLAKHQYLNVDNITQDYYDFIQANHLGHLIKPDWKENPSNIKLLLHNLDQLDHWRDLDWKKTFPEVAEFYKNYF